MRNKAIPFTLEVPITTIQKVNNRFINKPSGILEVYGKGRILELQIHPDDENPMYNRCHIEISSIMFGGAEVLPLIQNSACRPFFEEIKAMATRHCFEINSNIKK